ncbi:MAG: glutathione S-transferase N-terminal domain-containing protein [Rhodospirillales bacterium]|nr:glutathione S-transferase N-terminal domain-containing protein [Rhodospirillales bacterium]
MIELHSTPTPNGQKVMIMLEECGLEWTHVDVSIRLGDQFKPEFLKISPNNRIPAIIDKDGPKDSSGGSDYAMMESGAILIYLADKTGKFLPTDPRKHYDTLQWLMFQMGGIGPMFGQANHFNNYAKDKIQYAMDRYTNEQYRLYKVLDNRLANSEWIGCDEYSIADMATYPWVKGWKDRGLDDADHPNFMRWLAAMEARPAVQRNNEMATEIRERMAKDAEGKAEINMFDTKQNKEMLAEATKR